MKRQNKLLLWIAVSILICGAVFLFSRRTVVRPEEKARELAKPNADVTTAQKPSGVTSGGKASEKKISRGEHRPFVSMDVMERQPVLEEILKQDPLSMFHTWIQCGRVDHDIIEQQAVGTGLARSLREKAYNRDVYDQIEKFFGDDSTTHDERGHLLEVLSWAGTKDSLDILIHVATTSNDSDLRQFARQEIKVAAGWGRDELSPALEQVWRESEDRAMLGSVALAIGKIGAPSGVKLLLSAAIATEPENAARRYVAEDGLAQVISPHSVPMLSALLANQPSAGPLNALVAHTLNTIGDPTAASALLNWLQNADESAAPLARDFVVRARTPALLHVWESSLDPAVVFRSEKNRDAIRIGLAEYRKNRL